MAAHRVEIGRIRSVNAARRELRIGMARETLPADVEWLFVTGIDGRETRCRVERIKGDIATLAVGVTRDAVSRMRGATVCADVNVVVDDWQNRLTALDGFEVVDEAGVCLGTVVAVYATNANEAIEVERPDGGSFLLPVIDCVIASMDMKRGVMAVKDIAPYTVESTNPRVDTR